MFNKKYEILPPPSLGERKTVQETMLDFANMERTSIKPIIRNIRSRSKHLSQELNWSNDGDHANTSVNSNIKIQPRKSLSITQASVAQIRKRSIEIRSFNSMQKLGSSSSTAISSVKTQVGKETSTTSITQKDSKSLQEPNKNLSSDDDRNKGIGVENSQSKKTNEQATISSIEVDSVTQMSKEHKQVLVKKGNKPNIPPPPRNIPTPLARNPSPPEKPSTTQNQENVIDDPPNISNNSILPTTSNSIIFDAPKEKIDNLKNLINGLSLTQEVITVDRERMQHVYQSSLQHHVKYGNPINGSNTFKPTYQETYDIGDSVSKDEKIDSFKKNSNSFHLYGKEKLDSNNKLSSESSSLSSNEDKLNSIKKIEALNTNESPDSFPKLFTSPLSSNNDKEIFRETSTSFGNVEKNNYDSSEVTESPREVKQKPSKKNSIMSFKNNKEEEKEKDKKLSFGSLINPQSNINIESNSFDVKSFRKIHPVFSLPKSKGPARALSQQDVILAQINKFDKNLLKNISKKKKGSIMKRKSSTSNGYLEKNCLKMKRKLKKRGSNNSTFPNTFFTISKLKRIVDSNNEKYFKANDIHQSSNLSKDTAGKKDPPDDETFVDDKNWSVSSPPEKVTPDKLLMEINKLKADLFQSRNEVASLKKETNELKLSLEKCLPKNQENNEVILKIKNEKAKSKERERKALFFIIQLLGKDNIDEIISNQNHHTDSFFMTLRKLYSYGKRPEYKQHQKNEKSLPEAEVLQKQCQELDKLYSKLYKKRLHKQKKTT